MRLEITYNLFLILYDLFKWLDGTLFLLVLCVNHLHLCLSLFQLSLQLLNLNILCLYFQLHLILHILEWNFSDTLLFLSNHSISGSHDLLLFGNISLNHLIVFDGIICLSRRMFLKLLLKGHCSLTIHEELLFHNFVILCLHFLFLLFNILSWTTLIGDLFLKAIVCFHQSFNLIIKFYLLGGLLFLCLFNLFFNFAFKRIFFFKKLSHFFL